MANHFRKKSCRVPRGAHNGPSSTPRRRVFNEFHSLQTRVRRLLYRSLNLLAHTRHARR